MSSTNLSIETLLLNIMFEWFYAFCKTQNASAFSRFYFGNLNKLNISSLLNY